MAPVRPEEKPILSKSNSVYNTSRVIALGLGMSIEKSVSLT